jgi:hypothetical protein
MSLLSEGRGAGETPADSLLAPSSLFQKNIGERGAGEAPAGARGALPQGLVPAWGQVILAPSSLFLKSFGENVLIISIKELA